MKDICKTSVIVATRQIREAMIQRIVMFLFFIFNLCEFFALNTLFKSFFGVSKRKLLYCLYTTTSAILARFNIAFPPIPHLRRFFFCAVIHRFVYPFCRQITFAALGSHLLDSKIQSILKPRFSTTARTFF